jgi:hypothetical protein
MPETKPNKLEALRAMREKNFEEGTVTKADRREIAREAAERAAAARGGKLVAKAISKKRAKKKSKARGKSLGRHRTLDQ